MSRVPVVVDIAVLASSDSPRAARLDYRWGSRLTIPSGPILGGQAEWPGKMPLTPATTQISVSRPSSEPPRNEVMSCTAES
jgi:hypothetical protein